MNEKKNTTKPNKVMAFLKKHEHQFDLIATAAVAVSAGILIMEAVVKNDERKRWNNIEKNEFFKDADQIVRDRKGQFFSITFGTPEETENS